MKKLFFVFFLGASLVACKNESKEATDVAEANVGTDGTSEGAMATDVAMTPDAAPVATGPITSIKFDEMEYDFGTVKDGEKVTKIFKFTNTGNEPLVITNATASCGCTVPEWPKDAIAPGKTGELKAVFDSKGKGTPEGSRQSKTIDITANTEPAMTNLRIFGTVVGQPQAAQ
ncbi:MAG TPA: DUF1573 domain-containing protein [Saprospiraceae bacterium]|nr:DUF1573 domain-containing protein [Saprospiraceae bacterium]